MIQFGCLFILSCNRLRVTNFPNKSSGDLNWVTTRTQTDTLNKWVFCVSRHLHLWRSLDWFNHNQVFLATFSNWCNYFTQILIFRRMLWLSVKILKIIAFTYATRPWRKQRLKRRDLCGKGLESQLPILLSFSGNASNRQLIWKNKWIYTLLFS